MNPPVRTIRPRRALFAHRRADSAFAPAAFSLLELIIVLSIVVAVSAVAIPRYWSSLGRYRVELAARRLAADLALAQSKARATGQFRNVVFSGISPYYEISEELSPTDNRSVFSADLTKDPYAVAQDSFITTDHGRRVVFDGFGQPAQGLTLVISSAGHARIVSVDQASGTISVTTP